MAFQNLKKIGSGGFGVVYRAKDDKTGKICAVKRLPKNCTASEKRRFAREVKIQLGLRHKNVMPILDHDLESESPWLAMPQAKENLVTAIPAILNNEISLLKIFLDILKGVRYAHNKGVIHRDLKPANVMLFADQAVRVADFGLGKRIEESTLTTTLTITGDFLGTLAYSAPEQILNAKNADERSDIYSLGKILMHMLTGQIPYPIIRMDQIPSKYRYIVNKCLNDNPDLRYQTVSALIDDFESVAMQGNSDFQTIHTTLIENFNKLVDEPASEATIEEIDKLLFNNTSNKEFWQECFPLIKGEHLDVFFKYRRKNFLAHLRQYDSHIAGGLPFSYCDTVADLYQEILSKENDPSIQELILTRLLKMGVSHNRYYVMNTFCDILTGIRETSLAMAAIDVIKANPSEIVYLKEDLTDRNMLEIINKAVIEVVNSSTHPVQD